MKLLLLLLCVAVANGCYVMEKCQSCSRQGCYFVKMDDGALCLDAMEKDLGDKVSVVWPYSEEYCAGYVTTTTTTTLSSILKQPEATTNAVEYKEKTTIQFQVPEKINEGPNLLWLWILLSCIVAIIIIACVYWFKVKSRISPELQAEIDNHYNEIQDIA